MNQKVALFVVVATAIVAITGFLLVSFLLRPAGAGVDAGFENGLADARDGWVIDQRLVGDLQVNVEYDPAKVVLIVGAPPDLSEPPAPELSEIPPAPTEIPSGGESLEGTGGTEGGSGDGTSGGSSEHITGDTAGDYAWSGESSQGGVPEVIMVAYQVGPSDTLFGISQFHINRGQITSVALMARYGIGSTSLVPGTVINVPVANPAFCPGLRPYVVLEGDNAFRISQRAGISVAKLRQMNNLDARYTVYLTQVLCLP